MNILLKKDENRVQFIVADLGPALLGALGGLRFEAVPEGYARSFPVDSAAVDRTDIGRIYQQFALYAEPMIRQAAGAAPVPWEAALIDFLPIVYRQDVDWFLTGSAALAVRGLAVQPGDVDLVVRDEAGARRLAELMRPYLVEPLQATPGWIAGWFCRAMLRARVEWIGAPTAQADEPEPGDCGPAALARLETVTWRGFEVRVPPLTLQLAVCERRGLEERGALIKAHLAKQE